MKEKTRTQHKYSIVKIKKTLHITTAIAFFLQQVVPYSPVFAMEAPEEESYFETHKMLSFPSPQSLPLPEELTTVQQTLPSRLEKVRQSLEQTVLESVEALPDRFSSLIGDIRKTFAELPTDFRNKVGSKLPNLVKGSYSLYPWTFLRDEDDLGKVPVLTSDHAGFRRIKEVMGVLDDLSGESLLPPTFFPNLQQLQSEYKGYVETLCALPLDKRSSLLSPVCLWGDLFEGKSYLVSKSLAYKLLSMDSQGIPVKHNATGSSIVTHIGRLYAKQNLIKDRGEDKPPEGTLNPGMEWAMGSFHQLLIGDHIGSGLVPSAFLVLSQVPVEGSLSSEKEEEKKQLRDQARDFSTAAIDKKAIINRLYEDDALKSTQNYSLQITPEIEGEFLETFLQKALKNPKMFDELDKQQVQSLILSTFLMNPGDAKGDNLMVTKPNAQGKRHIISIDNDLSLASMIIKERENFHTLETRNILLSIPHLMDQEIDQEVREHFQSLNIPAFLLTWLKSLERHNTEYTGLQRFIDPKTFSLLQFPLKLRKGTGDSLVKRFQDLQHHLRLNPQSPVTLQSLYEQLDPLPALYTKTLLDQEQGPLKAFDVLYRQVRSLEKALELEKNPRMLNGAPIQVLLDQEHTPKDAYKERTQSIEEIAEEILKAIDFQALTPREGLQVLEEAAAYFPSALKRTIQRNTSLVGSFIPLLQNSIPLYLAALFIGTIPELLTQADEWGYSLLHRAIEAHVPEAIITYFLENGLDPDLSTQSKPPLHPLSPLDIAFSTYEPHLPSAFTALIKAGARVVTPQVALQFYKKLMSSRSVLSSSSNKERNSFFETLLSSFLALLERNQQLAWEFSLVHLLPEGDKKPGDVVVRTPDSKTRILSPDLQKQLFDKNWKIIPQNKEGKRDVGIIERHVHGVPLRFYVKEYPELPGLEEAVGSFMRRLFGFGAPYTELVRIGPIPFLISQEIRGKTAADVLKETSQFFDSQEAFDPYYTSALVLMNILINPEDGIFPNYIVEKLSNTSRLIGIDNDHAFVPGVVKDQKQSRDPIVQVKTILFGLDHMLKSTHPQVRAQFLKVDIGEFLEGWLRDLRQRNALYGDLFTQQERIALLPKKPDDPKSKGTYVGIPFQDNAIKDLYQKMSTLQSLLQESPQLTHLELLSKVEPHVGHRYGKGFTPAGKNFKERVQFVDGVTSQLSMSTSGRLFKSMNIPLKESLLETSTKDATKAQDYRPNKALEELKEIRRQHAELVLLGSQRTGGGSSSSAPTLNLAHLKTLKLEEHLEKILAQRSFKDITETDQRALFELMKERKFKNLILRDAHALQDRIFQAIQLEYLLRLNLEGCLALTDEVIPLIAEKALSLESLNLARITTKMKEMGRERKSRTDRTPLYIFFPSLIYLNISYGGLRTVLIDAPKLEVFKARAAKDLQTLEIRRQIEPPSQTSSSSALRKVDLRETQSFSLQSFLQLLQSHPHLSEVQTERAQQLSLFQYIAFQDIKMPVEEGNFEKFGELLKRATENNDFEAQLQLSKMYMEGRGVKQNIEHAREWYEKAFQNDHPRRKKILQLVEKQKNKEELDFSCKDLISIEMEFIMNLLKDQPLRKLNLKLNHIEAEGIRFLSEGLKDNASLQWLRLSYNNIRDEGACFLSEGLKKNTSLKKLKLEYSKIGDEGARFLSESLRGNTSLQLLGLNHNDIGDKGAHFLSEGLRSNTSLQELDLGFNDIGDEGARFLSEGLRGNTTLQVLYLGGNNIGDEGARFFSEGLRGNITLQVLNLGVNNIEDDGARFLSAVLRGNTSLQKLNLERNNIGDEGARALSEVLRGNTSLQVLDLGSNKIGAGGARALSEVLRNNTSLKKLYLNDNTIGVGGARALSEGLRVNTSLQVLNFGWNKIGAGGARALSGVLRENTTLQELSLRGSKIGAEGVRFLSEGLRGNTSIRELNLSQNNIGDEGPRALSEVLRGNTTLRELSLDRNNIGAEGARHLSEGLKGNVTLQKLNLDGNIIGDEGTRYISESLRNNTSLQELDLWSNTIGDEGTRYISEVLRGNTTLQKLDLRKNDIGNEGAHFLSEGLRGNTSLQQLNLRDNRIGDEGKRILDELKKQSSQMKIEY